MNIHENQIPDFKSPLSETASQLFDDLDNILGDSIPDQAQRDIRAFFDFTPIMEYTLVNNGEPYPDVTIGMAMQLGRTYGALDSVMNLLSFHEQTKQELRDNWRSYAPIHNTMDQIQTLMRLTVNSSLRKGRDEMFDMNAYQYSSTDKSPTSLFITEALSSHIQGNAVLLLQKSEEFLSSIPSNQLDSSSESIITTVIDILNEYLHTPQDNQIRLTDQLNVLSLAREELSSIGVIHGDPNTIEGKSMFTYDPLKKFTQLDAYPKLRAAYMLHGALMYMDRHAGLDQSLGIFYRTIHPIAWSLTNSVRLANQSRSISSVSIQEDMPHAVQMDFWKLSELLYTVHCGQVALNNTEPSDDAILYAQDKFQTFRNNPLSFIIETTYGSFDTWYKDILWNLSGGQEEHDSFVAMCKQQWALKGQTSPLDNLIIDQLYFEEIENRVLMQWIHESGYKLNTENPEAFSQEISEYHALYERDMRQQWQHSRNDDRFAFASILKRSTPTNPINYSNWNRVIHAVIKYTLTPSTDAQILRFINDNQLYRTLHVALEMIKYSDTAKDELFDGAESLRPILLLHKNTPLTYATVFSALSNIFLQESERTSPSRAAMALFEPEDNEQKDKWEQSCKETVRDWEQLEYDLKTALLLLS